MSELGAGGGHLTAVVHITRKATGITETYNVNVPVTAEQAALLAEQKPEDSNERNPHDHDS